LPSSSFFICDSLYKILVRWCTLYAKTVCISKILAKEAKIGLSYSEKKKTTTRGCVVGMLQ
jgi:hypothetical protein